jgi:argininosuccinate lyase
MKLWDKGYSLDKDIEKFTVGNDFLLDRNLVKYDVYASIAHALMLNKIKILTDDELNKLKKALAEILDANIEINQEDEDVHTAIEKYLTGKLGDLGKKIHTARSRNDQVLVDIRLFSKDKLLEVKKSVLDLANALLETAEANKGVPMPGYTHSRKAMPSSVGLFLGSYAESMLDNLKLLDQAINPLWDPAQAMGYRWILTEKWPQIYLVLKKYRIIHFTFRQAAESSSQSRYLLWPISWEIWQGCQMT